MVRLLEGSLLAAAVLLLACDGPSKSTPQSPKPRPATGGLAEGAETESHSEPDIEHPGEVGPDLEPAPAPSGISRVGSLDAADNPAAGEILLDLRRWVHRRGGQVYATLLDLEAGSVLATHRAAEPVNPASNMKLLTAAAALDLLGPSYTFRTELVGTIDASGHTAALTLRGGGDPGFSTAELFRLARVGVQRGLTQVERIFVDQSLFSDRFVPPAFEQQPEEWAPFRAPVSALALDQNSVALNVLSTTSGQPARIWYEPPGVVQAEGSIVTSAPGDGDGVAWSLDPTADPTWPVSRVSGRLAEGLGRRRYARRLADPRRAGGLALASLLADLGVQGDMVVELLPRDRQQDPGPLLAYLSSRSLAELLRPLGKDSDNFTAEMMLIALSAAKPLPENSSPAGGRVDPSGAGQPENPDVARAWSSERGAQRLLAWLREGNIPTEGLRIENGSGLFDANRLTTSALALTLARMEGRPEIFAEFLSQLAIYGTDGTLRGRKQDHPNRSRVRAKTGTLRDTDALTGYILRDAGKRPLVFSLIVKGARGGHVAVRRELDRTAFAWLELLSGS